MAKKDLVQLIKDNPGAYFEVDNDCWIMYRTDPKNMPDDADADEWFEQNELARDGEVIQRGSGYGSGHCHGGDILQALAVLQGVTVESV